MKLETTLIRSSLTLQKLLYFNEYLLFVFAFVQIVHSIWKSITIEMKGLPRILVPVLMCVWIIIEYFRLRLGKVGNLRELVPELSAFWLLSIIPQLPGIIYLSFFQTPGIIFPLDVALGIPMSALIGLEVLVSYDTIRSFIHNQTTDFLRLCQLEGIERATMIAQSSRLPSQKASVAAAGIAASSGAAGQYMPDQASRATHFSPFGRPSSLRSVHPASGSLPSSPVQTLSAAPSPGSTSVPSLDRGLRLSTIASEGVQGFRSMVGRADIGSTGFSRTAIHEGGLIAGESMPSLREKKMS